MGKIMVLGDTHGNIRAAKNAVAKADSLDIDTIMQVGDFGLWDHFLDGVQFLDELNTALWKNDQVLIWTDGNHENFDRLWWYLENNPKTTNGHVFIRSQILYSPRGNSWYMHGRKFMTVGGAVSIDKDYRLARETQEGKSRTLWWDQEQLTQADMDAILGRNHGTVDYLFTHDCPTNAPFRERLKNDPDSQMHRQKMDELGKHIKPTLWFHGHMHSKYDAYDFPMYEPTTTVYGLECDGMLDNWGILDTDDNSYMWGGDYERTLFYREQDQLEDFEIDDNF